LILSTLMTAALFRAISSKRTFLLKPNRFHKIFPTLRSHPCRTFLK
jgi:hypothetical protein